VPGDALVRSSYTPRADPDYYYSDEPGEVVYQPDVYANAAVLGEHLGAGTIIDVGCGNAEKLSHLADRFEIIGVDYGPNIATCRAAYPSGIWMEHDLDAATSLDVSATRSVVICADVIEHVRRPAALADKLLHLLHNGALVALISTPERDVTHGIGHRGPPPNPAHAREWTIRELGAFLRRRGFQHGTLGLTRNNTAENLASTILAAYVSDANLLQTVEDSLIDAPVQWIPPARRGASARGRVLRRLRR
jgi:SAM-dependent methyltransferase